MAEQRTLQYRGMEVFKAKYDLIFKEVFLGDLELLASLVSSILELDVLAGDIAVLNTELVPAFESGRLSRLDIRIKTSDRHPVGHKAQKLPYLRSILRNTVLLFGYISQRICALIAPCLAKNILANIG